MVDITDIVFHTRKVILSCKTPAQLEAAERWAFGLLLNWGAHIMIRASRKERAKNEAILRKVRAHLRTCCIIADVSVRFNQAAGVMRGMANAFKAAQSMHEVISGKLPTRP